LSDMIWIAVLSAFAVWWLAVALLDSAGVLKKLNITAWGPLIMWRTYRGQGFLDGLSRPKKAWRMLINICIPIVVLSMIMMLGVTLLVDVLMIINTPAPGPANAPQNILAIPGLNQFIPFYYGWIALIVAMIVHEFGHAIAAKVENIKVKSLGLLLIPIPIGAFAEIDEEELFGTKSEDVKSDVIGPIATAPPEGGKRKANSMQFVRILSAGVISNFIVALIAFALLFGPVMGAIGGVNSDAVVVNVTSGSPAALAGLHMNTLVQSIDGMPVNNSTVINRYVDEHAGSDIAIGGSLAGSPVNYTLHVNETKMVLADITPGTPADHAGLKPGLVIVGMDNVTIKDPTGFKDFMSNTSPNESVMITALDNGTEKKYNVTLATGTTSSGFLGVIFYESTTSDLGMSMGSYNAADRVQILKSLPYSVSGWLTVMFLPILEIGGNPVGFSAFQSDLSVLFYPTGWATPLGGGIFAIALCLFWIGWLNLNIALFNCLPMVPLDGGHIFRESMRMIAGKFVKDEKKAEKISGIVTDSFAIVLFASIVLMIVGPYVLHGLG
jgi:membrane-associated protease RseP (regulator of RpoE activity)